MLINTYQLLRQVGLSEQRVIRLLPLTKITHFNAGELIWPNRGELQPWIHVVSGLVSVSAPGEDGNINPINIYGPGTWLGETAILDEHPAPLEFACLTAAEVVSLPFAEMSDAFKHESDFARYIARLVSWRDQRRAEMLMLLRSGTPALRVVLGLALFADAMLCNSSHLPPHQSSNFLEIPLKQSLLASMCGVSRGVFSACVQQLAAAGYLRISYATLSLQDIGTWDRFSQAQRQNHHNRGNASMPEILSLMKAVSAPHHQLARSAT